MDTNKKVYAIDNDSTFRHNRKPTGLETEVWLIELRAISDISKLCPFVERLRDLTEFTTSDALTNLSQDEVGRFWYYRDRILESISK
jgi:hypothetical protein